MTTYYESENIVVTDTVFMTAKGDQYPIRNISSVMVRQFTKKTALIIGTLFFLIGLFLFISSKFGNGIGSDSDTFVFYIFIGAIALAWWYFGRKYVLFIGSGGKQQEALTFPMWRGNKVATLQKISNAINQSIAGLQKT